MKKFLIATTALALSAGVASAQQVSTTSGALSITGEGRLGINYDSTRATRTVQENRFQLNFSVSKETDSGVTFGAFSRVRITNADAVGRWSGSRVWAQVAGFRFTVGNSDGAIRGVGTSHGYAGGCAIGYEGGIACGDTAGLTGAGITHAFASQGGGHASQFRVDYTVGTTALALSHQRNGTTEIAARHRFGDITVAAGLARGGVTDVTTVSAAWAANGYSVGALVARVGANTNGSLSASAAFGANSVGGYIGRVGGLRTYGLNYAYDLGGARLVVGAERVGAQTVASAGAVFTF